MCLTLETGGLIIAWLSFIGSIVATILFGIAFILICAMGCKEITTADNYEACTSFKGVIIGLLVVFALLFIAFAYIAWRCIQGVKTRDHVKVKPMLILLGICTALAALQIFQLTAATIGTALVQLAIDVYCFIVMYSLYDLFRREFETGGNNRPNLQYQVAGKV